MGKGKTQSTAMPPSFYEKDMEKWNNEKFEKALKERKEAKALLLKSKQDLANLTTKNTNLVQSDGSSKTFSMPKRRMSRQSNLTFSNVDFNYIGDTAVYSHLINHRLGGVGPNKAQLGFEVNLRNYQCGTTFKAQEPFMYPKTKEIKAIDADQSAHKYHTTLTSPLNAQSRVLSEGSDGVYNDKFKLKNVQSIRHSFVTGNISLTALQEASNLRVVKDCRKKKLVPDSDEEEDAAPKKAK